MSALIPSQQERRELGGDLSKRERMKLEMAMRREDSLQNQEIKHPKRRGHSSLHAKEPNRRKEVKIDPNPARSPHDQLYSSPINSSEPLSTTPPNPAEPPRVLPVHLNPLYRLPEGDAGIFNYLLHYSYSEGEKRLEKECQDWSGVDQLEQAPLAMRPSPASVALCQKINNRIWEVKDRLREPLGKIHRELNQKFLKKNSFNFLLFKSLKHHSSPLNHKKGPKQAKKSMGEKPMQGIRLLVIKMKNNSIVNDNFLDVLETNNDRQRSRESYGIEIYLDIQIRLLLKGKLTIKKDSFNPIISILNYISIQIIISAICLQSHYFTNLVYLNIYQC